MTPLQAFPCGGLALGALGLALGLVTNSAAWAASDSDAPALEFSQPKISVPEEGSSELPEAERGDKRSWAGIRMDRFWAEGGWLTDLNGEPRGSHYLHLKGHGEWEPSRGWSLRVGARADGYWQTGKPAVAEGRIDYGAIYVRYNGPDTRITLGAQEILWGRVDEIPPTDRMSTPDLRRFLLDDHADRRLPLPALRLETFQGSWKIDLVGIPAARHARLPDKDSIWSPIDPNRGRFINTDPDPAFAELVRQGTIEDREGYGAWEAGLRLSYTGTAAEGAVTLQRVRRSNPYYELARSARQTLLAGGTLTEAVQAVSDPTFKERHPTTWVVGGDLVVPDFLGTWRLEGAWLSDVPVTTSQLGMITVNGWEAVIGNEYYPGDGDLRVNLQLAGRGITETGDFLDRTEVYRLNGSLERPFLRARWNAELEFALGLDEREVFLHTELAYQAWEPHEIYVGAYFFSGEPNTAGGFHEAHDLMVIGWRSLY